MCAGAILQARVPVVVWGAADPKAGAVESLYRLFEDPRLNHRVDHTGHVMADECGRILSDFFRQKRKEDRLQPVMVLFGTGSAGHASRC